jgi:hypothetical protein
MFKTVTQVCNFIGQYLVCGEQVRVSRIEQNEEAPHEIGNEISKDGFFIEGIVKRCNCGALMGTLETQCPLCKARYSSFMPWELSKPLY